MANKFSFADWVCMETLADLLNELVIAPKFNTDYNKEFTRPYAVGETVRVKLPQRFKVTDGLGYQPQELNRQETTVTVDQIFGIHFEHDSIEQALKMERGREMFKKEYLDKARAQIAQEIDSRAALFAYQNTNNIVGVLGTDPTSTTVFGSARQVMLEKACPPGEKLLALSPAAMAGAVNGSTTIFNPASEISRQYKEGSIGRARGFDCYESMSLYSHTAGTWQSTVSCAGAGQTGSTLAINCTSGDTFKKGDVFKIDNVLAVNPKTRRSTGSPMQFVVQADVTAVATTASLPISPAIAGPGDQYQNVNALNTDTAALTLFPGTNSPNGKSGTQGLALQEDAFALVGVDLDIPTAAEFAGRARDPKTGISVAFFQMFDPIQRKRITRLDVLLGFGALYPNEAAVRVLSA